MNSYQSMTSALAPTGLYAMSGAVAAELRAYALELDRLYDEADAILSDGFIATASGDVLAGFERIFGPERRSNTLSERRQMLLDRVPLGSDSFTREKIARALAGMGLTAEIAEYPALYRLNILGSGSYTAAEQRFIRRECERLCPAHLDLQVVFNTATWQQLDDRERDFASLDTQNLTWDQIDEQTAS